MVTSKTGASNARPPAPQPRYTTSPTVQVVLALLKAHGVRTIVASPGTTNSAVTASVQTDPDFNVISVVDERSAGYVAVGVAAATGEPVALTCTGATASINYLSALTEAYYRKLPLVALTSMDGRETVGNLVAQSVDRSVVPNDVARISVKLPVLREGDSTREAALLVNKALLELRRAGGGPVHIDLAGAHGGHTFTARALPDIPVVRRFTTAQLLHDDDGGGDDGANRRAIPPAAELLGKRVAVSVTSRQPFTGAEAAAVERFAEAFDAPIIVDRTSGYTGPLAVHGSLLARAWPAAEARARGLMPEVIVHIGQVGGSDELRLHPAARAGTRSASSAAAARPAATPGPCCSPKARTF